MPGAFAPVAPAAVSVPARLRAARPTARTSGAAPQRVRWVLKVVPWVLSRWFRAVAKVRQGAPMVSRCGSSVLGSGVFLRGRACFRAWVQVCGVRVCDGREADAGRAKVAPWVRLRRAAMAQALGLVAHRDENQRHTGGGDGCWLVSQWRAVAVQMVRSAVP